MPAICNSFDYIADTDARILILGSMPGVTSLRENNYYAHPQNCFWWLMSEYWDCDFTELDYKRRYTLLKTKGIALWDVLKQCQRRGSLDAAIDIKSAELNDFESFFANFHSITHIVCNGGVAFRQFKSNVYLPLQLQQTLVQLPSTSAAHARMHKAQKLQHWGRVLDDCFKHA